MNLNKLLLDKRLEFLWAFAVVIVPPLLDAWNSGQFHGLTIEGSLTLGIALAGRAVMSQRQAQTADAPTTLTEVESAIRTIEGFLATVDRAHTTVMKVQTQIPPQEASQVIQP